MLAIISTPTRGSLIVKKQQEIRVHLLYIFSQSIFSSNIFHSELLDKTLKTWMEWNLQVKEFYMKF